MRTRVTSAVIIATVPIWFELVVMCTADAPQKQAGSSACKGRTCSTDDAGTDGNTGEDSGPTPSKPGETRACTQDSDCARTEYCARGVCAADACEPGATRCDQSGLAVIVCSPAGDREVQLFCNTGQSCGADAGQARCSDWVCVPGAARCTADGNKVETCAKDGLSSDVTADCVKKHQVCAAAACMDTACTPSTKLCDANAAYQCSADGTSRTLLEQCSDQQYCDAASTACKARECTPGGHECRDGKPATCSADGSGWQVGDACPSGDACSLGTCQPIACKAGESFCLGGNVTRCGADGLSWATTAYCSSDTHCAESPSGVSCETDACTPGAPTCSDNVATVCKLDGTGPVAGGTDCGASSVCMDGACQQKVCVPGALFCSDNNVDACDSLGLGFTVLANCATDEYCDAVAAACATRVCGAGTHGCIGESYGSCNSVGSGYTASPIDCTATAKVCTGAQGCVSSAVDELAATATGGSGPSRPTFYGNFITVSVSRTLTKIEMALSQIIMPFQGSLQWAVFESTGGAFTRIATDTTTYSPATFSSSNALGVSLVAGRSYVIGVYFQPGADSLIVNGASTPPEKTSFGEAIGIVVQESATLPTSLPTNPTQTDVVEHQRLTTGPAK